MHAKSCLPPPAITTCNDIPNYTSSYFLTSNLLGLIKPEAKTCKEETERFTGLLSLLKQDIISVHVSY